METNSHDSPMNEDEENFEEEDEDYNDDEEMSSDFTMSDIPDSEKNLKDARIKLNM